MNLGTKCLKLISVLALLVLVSGDAMAHGERAQLASMRMRTVHWFDIKVEPQNVKVGDTIVMTGKFIPSKFWPEQLPSVEDTFFLNVGLPGPKFIRVNSEINGVPMIRSTAAEKGKLYEFKVVVRARVAGRYHMHPLLNVKDAGTLVGKGTWIDVDESDSDAPYVNEVTTMQGDVIDLENYALGNVYFWHVVWIVLGLAYLIYWLILPRAGVFIPRYMFIAESGIDKANSLVTRKDFMVSGVFFTVTLAIILTGYLWAESKYPVTIPLQTGKVEVVGLEVPTGGLEIKVENATYELTGRNLSMRTRMKNTSASPIRIAEFITANIRFINDKVPGTGLVAGEEMVSKNGLSVSVDVIAPGQEVDVLLKAEDALWEKYRMTGLIYDPDSRFAGMLFYYDAQGNRYQQEVGGAVLPSNF